MRLLSSLQNRIFVATVAVALISIALTGRFVTGRVERQAESDQIARVAAAGTQAAKSAFQIANICKLRAKIIEAGGIFDKRLHHILPAADGFDSGKRLRKPVAQQTRTHGRDRAINCAVERGVARCVMV